MRWQIVDLAGQLEHLTYLNVSHPLPRLVPLPLLSEAIGRLGVTAPRLRTLHIADTDMADLELLPLQYLEHLEELDLAVNPKVTLAGLEALLRCPALARLNLFQCSRVRVHDLEPFRERGVQLETLGCCTCPHAWHLAACALGRAGGAGIP